MSLDGDNPYVPRTRSWLTALFMPTSTPEARRPRNRRSTIAACCWCLLVFACAGVMVWTSRQPGLRNEPPAVLPASMTSYAIDGLPTVFIAFHPHCPCTRATVANLERAFSSSSQRLNFVALVYTPSGRPPDWADTDTVRRLAAFRGVRMVTDADGSTASAMGLKTSGEILAYDTRGNLAFAGGVTPSRGHEGDCAGLTILSDLLAGRSRTTDLSPASTDVYGCPLCNDAAPSTDSTRAIEPP